MKVKVISLSPHWSSLDLKARCPHCELVVWAESQQALRHALAMHLLDRHRVQALFGGKGPHTTLSAERERVRRERRSVAG